MTVSPGGFYFFQASGFSIIAMTSSFVPVAPAPFSTVAGARGQLWAGAPKLGVSGTGSISTLPAEMTAVFQWNNAGQAFKFWFRGFPDGFQTLKSITSYRYYFFQSSTANISVTQ